MLGLVFTFKSCWTRNLLICRHRYSSYSQKPLINYSPLWGWCDCAAVKCSLVPSVMMLILFRNHTHSSLDESHGRQSEICPITHPVFGYRFPV